MAQAHTIHTRDGGTVTIPKFTQQKAIRAFCSECFQWEGNPKDECTSPLCPLYIYRGNFRAHTRALKQSQRAAGHRTSTAQGHQHR